VVSRLASIGTQDSFVLVSVQVNDGLRSCFMRT
jgi:hypothetical protein